MKKQSNPPPPSGIIRPPMPPAPPAPRLARFQDGEETVYSAELSLLRRVAETSSDMVMARDWPEFREAAGGQEKLDKAHAEALREYEQWLSAGEE